MISSTEFKTHLGEYLTEAMHKAVFVKRRSNEAVLISKKEYDRLQSIEDSYWLNKALEAVDELKNIISEMLFGGLLCGWVHFPPVQASIRSKFFDVGCIVLTVRVARKCRRRACSKNNAGDSCRQTSTMEGCSAKPMMPLGTCMHMRARPFV